MWTSATSCARARRPSPPASDAQAAATREMPRGDISARRSTASGRTSTSTPAAAQVLRAARRSREHDERPVARRVQAGRDRVQLAVRPVAAAGRVQVEDGARRRRRQGATSTSSTRAPGGRLGHAVGVQDVGEQLEPVDEPRAGPREVRRGVDRDDAPGAERPQPVREQRGLLVRARRVVAARHADDDLGLGGGDHLPGRVSRVLAGEAEHVLAARHLDELRRPVAGDEDRVEPLQRRHARARRAPRTARRTRVDPRALPGDEVQRRVARPGRLRDRAHVAHRLAEGLRVQRDHLRALGQRLRRSWRPRRRRPRRPGTAPA